MNMKKDIILVISAASYIATGNAFTMLKATPQKSSFAQNDKRLFSKPNGLSVNDEVANQNHLDQDTSRRDMLRNAAFGAFSILAASPSNANAFANKVSTKYDDRPKRRGPQPKDLNIGTRKDMNGEPYQGLKQCGAAPNCFSTTDFLEEDPEHVIPSWKWPKSIATKKEAFEQLETVLKGYQPGQNNIDGGGFQIVKSDLDNGYIYVQFESLKNGYIDDFELAYMESNAGEVQVRSSSRVGYLDFGVNAKRINNIAKQLRAMGWDAVGVDPSTHQDYVMQNSYA